MLIAGIILMAVGLSPLLIYWICEHGNPLKRPAKPRPEIVMLADLIKMDRDWVKDEYVWFHPSGVSLWIANKRIGLSVRWRAKNNREYHALADAGKWRLTPPEYNLVVAAMGGEGVKVADSEVAAVAQRITEMYGNDKQG